MTEHNHCQSITTTYPEVCNDFLLPSDHKPIIHKIDGKLFTLKWWHLLLPGQTTNQERYITAS
jgi:hypothetical protein